MDVNTGTKGRVRAQLKYCVLIPDVGMKGYINMPSILMTP